MTLEDRIGEERLLEVRSSKEGAEEARRRAGNFLEGGGRVGRRGKKEREERERRREGRGGGIRGREEEEERRKEGRVAMADNSRRRHHQPFHTLSLSLSLSRFPSRLSRSLSL